MEMTQSVTRSHARLLEPECCMMKPTIEVQRESSIVRSLERGLFSPGWDAVIDSLHAAGTKVRFEAGRVFHFGVRTFGWVRVQTYLSGGGVGLEENQRATSGKILIWPQINIRSLTGFGLPWRGHVAKL